MTNFFPTIYSTLDPAALSSLIRTNYKFSATTCKFLVRGVGDTYKVMTNDGDFILRIYRSSHRNLPQIKEELFLLTELKKASLSVSYPIADRHGEMIQTLNAAEGPRYAVLFSYAPGQSVNILNKEQLKSLGREMAAFHNISSAIDLGGARWQYDIDTTLDKPLEMVRDAFSGYPQDYEWWVLTAEETRAQWRNTDANAFSKGYCQYDFLPKNFHFAGDQITLFDFDFLGKGWLVNDLMSFWTHLCLDTHFGRMTQHDADQAFAILLKAYRNIRPIDEAELAAIPWLSFSWWCYYMGFHTTHEQFYPLVQPAHLSLRTDLIRQLKDRYWPQKP